MLVNELTQKHMIIRNIYEQKLDDIISETKKIIDQSGEDIEGIYQIDKKAVQQQRDKYFDILDEIAGKVETIDFMELSSSFDMKILNYILIK